MKQLIVDYLPFEIQSDQINESMKENNGKVIVKGVLQRADTKNQNGRVYPKDILMREAKKYFKKFYYKYFRIDTDLVKYLHIGMKMVKNTNTQLHSVTVE